MQNLEIGLWVVLVLTKAEFVPLIFDENQTTIDEEAYECADCDKLFVLRKSLLTHRRLSFIHPQEPQQGYHVNSIRW